MLNLFVGFVLGLIVMAFLSSNTEKLRDLSLRQVIKLGQLRKSAPTVEKFNKTARVICCK
jgi:hypothetical protein